MPGMDKRRVEEIFTQSKREKWPYPKIFDALKDAGVDYYETDVATHVIVYHGGGEWVTEAPPAGFGQVSPNASFDAAAVKLAIQRNQHKLTNYTTFVREIAAAGVNRYRVDMAARTVAYRGSRGNEYVEKVPQP